MPKSKLIYAIALIIILSAFLVGCGAIEDAFGVSPTFCCNYELLILPMVAICIKLFK